MKISLRSIKVAFVISTVILVMSGLTLKILGDDKNDHLKSKIDFLTKENDQNRALAEEEAQYARQAEAECRLELQRLERELENCNNQ